MAAGDFVTEAGLQAALAAIATDVSGLVDPTEGELWSAHSLITALAEDDEVFIRDISTGLFHRMEISALRTALARQGLPLSHTLASDDTVSTTAVDDITGINWPVISGRMYHMKASGIYRTAATTTGLSLAYSGPAMTYGRHYAKMQQGAAGTDQFYENFQNALTTAITNTAVVAANTDYAFFAEAWFQPSANGTFQARHGSEVGASNAIVRAGSVWTLTDITGTV